MKIDVHEHVFDALFHACQFSELCALGHVCML